MNKKNYQPPEVYPFFLRGQQTLLVALSAEGSYRDWNNLDALGESGYTDWQDGGSAGGNSYGDWDASGGM